MVTGHHHGGTTKGITMGNTSTLGTTYTTWGPNRVLTHQGHLGHRGGGARKVCCLYGVVAPWFGDPVVSCVGGVVPRVGGVVPRESPASSFSSLAVLQATKSWVWDFTGHLTTDTTGAAHHCGITPQGHHTTRARTIPLVCAPVVWSPWCGAPVVWCPCHVVFPWCGALWWYHHGVTAPRQHLCVCFPASVIP